MSHFVQNSASRKTLKLLADMVQTRRILHPRFQIHFPLFYHTEAKQTNKIQIAVPGLNHFFSNFSGTPNDIVTLRQQEAF